MTFMGWAGSGQFQNVPLTSTRFLQIMSELTVGWLLLEAAVIALSAQKKLDKSHPDWAFYEGKKCSAIYWAQNVLAAVPSQADIIRSADPTPYQIPNEAFATV